MSIVKVIRRNRLVIAYLMMFVDRQNVKRLQSFHFGYKRQKYLSARLQIQMMKYACFDEFNSRKHFLRILATFNVYSIANKLV